MNANRKWIRMDECSFPLSLLPHIIPDSQIPPHSGPPPQRRKCGCGYGWREKRCLRSRQSRASPPCLVQSTSVLSSTPPPNSEFLSPHSPLSLFSLTPLKYPQMSGLLLLFLLLLGGLFPGDSLRLFPSSSLRRNKKNVRRKDRLGLLLPSLGGQAHPVLNGSQRNNTHSVFPFPSRAEAGPRPRLRMEEEGVGSSRPKRRRLAGHGPQQR